MRALAIRGSEPYPITGLPVGKVICLAQNYPKHSAEMKSTPPPWPYFFLKPATALLPPDGTVVLPDFSSCVHHEVELYALIGKEGRHIPQEAADEHIAGFGILLDLTARDIQTEGKKSGRPFGISKSWDTSAPISDATKAEVVGGIEGAQDLAIELRTNGELRQSARTSQMLYKLDELVAFLSRVMTLEPGDIIATGTPEGVSEIVAGDVVEASIEKLGGLKVDVVGSG